MTTDSKISKTHQVSSKQQPIMEAKPGNSLKLLEIEYRQGKIWLEEVEEALESLRLNSMSRSPILIMIWIRGLEVLSLHLTNAQK